jgi:uroporphyrinogen-III synthase
VLRAVLTREDVEAYAAQLSPLGVEVVAMPVTQQRDNEDDRERLARALWSGPYLAVFITSRHAVHYFASATIRATHDDVEDVALAAHLGEIWAVGHVTQEVLEAQGITSHYPIGVRDGTELARALIEAHDLRGQRVLVPRAEHGRTEGIELLRAAGAEVVDVVAYRTHTVTPADPSVAAGRKLLIGGTADVCAVFAPSQVAALAAIVGPLAAVQVRFCAIGETTAATLRAAGVTGIGVAATPTPDGLATAVRTLLATSP